MDYNYEQGKKISRSQAIRNILTELQEAIEFETAFLVSTEGLVLTTVPADADANQVSALAALLARMYKTACRIQKQLGEPPLNKVTMRNGPGRQLVGRWFETTDYSLFLALIIADPQPHRQAITQAIRAICRVWNDREL